MSAYSDYVNGLLDLIKEGRPDPLKHAIYARLINDRKQAGGLISPSLSNGEDDENAVLYRVYQIVAKDAGQKKGAEDLRRVVVELLMDALSRQEKDIALIDALGRLAGFFEVRKSPKLAEQFRQQLFGHMESKLEKPFYEMMQLEGEHLDCARRVLGLWLAVTPSMPQGWKTHHTDAVIRLFENGINNFQGGVDHFYLLLLMFRAIMKINPQYAGKSGFLKMCDTIKKRESHSHIYNRAWLGLCRRYGILFAKYANWRMEFKKGIIKIENIPDDTDLFWKGLERMNRLDQEMGETRKSGKIRRDVIKSVPLRIIGSAKV